MTNKQVEERQKNQAYDAAIAFAADLSPLEGVNATLDDDVTVLRTSKSVPRVPVLYEPCIVFVLQGTKRGFVGPEKFVYDEKTVLIMAAPTPFEVITETPEDGPLLAVYIRIRRELVIELIRSVQPTLQPSRSAPRGIESIPIDLELADSLTRLLRALCSRDDARVLSRQLVREITYRILKSGAGEALAD
jgi:hypothetical protein